MPVVTNVDDLKQLHRRRTPKMFFDYCESGSWTEQTFRENTSYRPAPEMTLLALLDPQAW